jgi:hypothetical protein
MSSLLLAGLAVTHRSSLATSGWESRRHFDWWQSGVTFYIMLLSNVTMKCSLPTQIWLHMQRTWKQDSIVQFTPFDYGEKLICHISTHQAWWHEVLPTFYILLCKGLEMMGSDNICTASRSYICTCSVLMSSLPFTIYLTNYKWELSKDTFLVQFFSQLYTYKKW